MGSGGAGTASPQQRLGGEGGFKPGNGKVEHLGDLFAHFLMFFRQSVGHRLPHHQLSSLTLRGEQCWMLNVVVEICLHRAPSLHLLLGLSFCPVGLI